MQVTIATCLAGTPARGPANAASEATAFASNASVAEGALTLLRRTLTQMRVHEFVRAHGEVAAVRPEVAPDAERIRKRR